MISIEIRRFVGLRNPEPDVTESEINLQIRNFLPYSAIRIRSPFMKQTTIDTLALDVY
jgi:hypothetical protein